MNEVVIINGTEMSIREWNGMRVVMFADVDVVHGRPNGTARKRFNGNKRRFVKGEDYYIVKPNDLKTLDTSQMSVKRTFGINVNSPHGFYVGDYLSPTRNRGI